MRAIPSFSMLTSSISIVGYDELVQFDGDSILLLVEWIGVPDLKLRRWFKISVGGLDEILAGEGMAWCGMKPRVLILAS